MAQSKWEHARAREGALHIEAGGRLRVRPCMTTRTRPLPAGRGTTGCWTLQTPQASCLRRPPPACPGCPSTSPLPTSTNHPSEPGWGGQAATPAEKNPQTGPAACQTASLSQLAFVPACLPAHMPTCPPACRGAGGTNVTAEDDPNDGAGLLCVAARDIYAGVPVNEWCARCRCAGLKRRVGAPLRADRYCSFAQVTGAIGS